ncbi:pyruvate dehydrogenase (acetyl-transferring) E1 component subunit alpha [Halobaculum lipolyticum]|uniref:Pyruvate dehydrogenase (Acetyl-transferring) E1 component subunit alpha n=1 Tax=Halobaculum lipolyticum TaxID=3032001 RepID=A0ABD5WB29_9EURY|nr:pyruvate dehydrogenase (acetyl-transferring) E1 component subunit alpha [Halobaculum sp. DT31]
MPRSTVAEFTIESVRILDEKGAVDEELVPSLSEETLIDLYRQMRRSRRLDERAIALQRRGELGTYAPAIGQEAAQVGSAAALDTGDWIVPAFREQVLYVMRGTPLHKILWYAMGMEEGAEIPDGANVMPPSIPVGSQALHATGIGWGKALRGEQAAAITYFGDGATSHGDVYEALNFAGAYDAQTVFLCQNNQYAISTPRRVQSRAETLAQKAVAAGIKGIQVDGNDVLGVYAATTEALEHARQGNPVLIEAETYRRSMHTTSDDPSVYRSDEEEAEWEKRDPITRFETYLRSEDVLDDDRIEDIGAAIESELEEAIARAKAGQSEVDPVDMFRHTFAELPPVLEQQLAEYKVMRDE